MVMYYLGMKYLVHPIIRWQDRLDEKRRMAIGEARGIAIGAARSDAKWRAWYQRRFEAQARGEPFDEPPPNPPQGQDC